MKDFFSIIDLYLMKFDALKKIDKKFDEDDKKDAKDEVWF